MHSIKKFVFVLVALMGFMPINAQSVLNKTISSLPNYFNKKDTAVQRKNLGHDLN